MEKKLTLDAKDEKTELAQEKKSDAKTANNRNKKVSESAQKV